MKKSRDGSGGLAAGGLGTDNIVMMTKSEDKCTKRIMASLSKNRHSLGLYYSRDFQNPWNKSVNSKPWRFLGVWIFKNIHT